MLLCHVDDNYKQIENLVYNNHKNYCDNNGILYKKVYTKDICNKELINKQIYWIKLFALEKELENNPSIEWIFLLDIDCVFLKQNISLDFFTNSCHNNQHILLCYQHRHMQNFSRVNIGAAFFRNTQYVRFIIKDMLRIAKEKKFDIYEQDFLEFMLYKNYMHIKDHVGFFPEHSFNNGHSESFLFHACSYSSISKKDSIENIINKKCDLLKKYLNN